MNHHGQTIVPVTKFMLQQMDLWTVEGSQCHVTRTFYAMKTSKLTLSSTIGTSHAHEIFSLLSFFQIEIDMATREKAR
jgi:hypothetical protein